MESDEACLRWVARLAGADASTVTALRDEEREAVEVLRRAPALARYLVTRMRAELELVLAQQAASPAAAPKSGGGGGVAKTLENKGFREKSTRTA